MPQNFDKQTVEEYLSSKPDTAKWLGEIVDQSIKEEWLHYWQANDVLMRAVENYYLILDSEKNDVSMSLYQGLLFGLAASGRFYFFDSSPPSLEEQAVDDTVELLLPGIEEALLEAGYELKEMLVIIDGLSERHGIGELDDIVANYIDELCPIITNQRYFLFGCRAGGMIIKTAVLHNNPDEVAMSQQEINDECFWSIVSNL